MNKIIKNTSADWIEVTDSPLSTKGITIKAVGYPSYTTTHLNLANVIELRDFLNEVINSNTPIAIDSSDLFDGMFTKHNEKLNRKDVKALAELILRAY